MALKVTLWNVSCLAPRPSSLWVKRALSHGAKRPQRYVTTHLNFMPILSLFKSLRLCQYSWYNAYYRVKCSHQFPRCATHEQGGPYGAMGAPDYVKCLNGSAFRVTISNLNFEAYTESLPNDNPSYELYSVWLQTGRLGLDLRQSQKAFPLASVSEVHPASYPMGTVGRFPRGKVRRWRDAQHSPPSSAEVKNE
jgi:hypothetical protein